MRKDTNSIPSSKVTMSFFSYYSFTDLCPKACDNFVKLCTGENGVDGGTCAKLHYLNCPIHRLVAGGWLQCGDIVDGSGANSVAATGEDGKVQDECFTVNFGSRMGGMVGFSTSSPHSNGSQFFITFGPCEWMNEKFVGIGRVIQGYEVLKSLEQAPTKNQKPVIPIIVSNCGKGIGVR
jgi:cyclophilin family peptidyl-prolyl cis-trans isomerase